MGREIRMVPPNWEQPQVVRRNGRVGYQPMFDRDFEAASKEWAEGFMNWQNGNKPYYFDASKYPKDFQYWEWSGMPPKREYYRPWKEEEATWFQVWETVSEGTPVTPAFATKEELVDYLVANGDFWDQSRRKEGHSTMPCAPWLRANAEAFVNRGSAPSLIVEHSSNGVTIKTARDTE